HLHRPAGARARIADRDHAGRGFRPDLRAARIQPQLMRERRGVSLRALNSFGVEAQAARLVDIDDAGDLARLAERLRGGPAPLVLGGGSNILFARDPAMPVVRIAIRGRRLLADDSRTVLVEAGAGEDWNEFVDWTL